METRAINDPKETRQFRQFAEIVARATAKRKVSFSFVPSENVLSPLAHACLQFDLYNRYYLEDLRLFGHWAFPDGRFVAEVEEEILLPSLRRITGARHISIRALSGMNNLVVILAALTQQGATIGALDPNLGGHVCTGAIAERLGLSCKFLTSDDGVTLNTDSLEVALESNPQLLYIDQANVLWPIDIPYLARKIFERSLRTGLFLDSSHINGLIMGNALPNPLQGGALAFGGSTHKTFPGPQKAFFATNDEVCFRRYQGAASNFISHHHPGEVLALALSAIEFEQCGGERYAKETVRTAKLFAEALREEGVVPLFADRGYTSTHQVWVPITPQSTVSDLANRCFDSNLHLNILHGLPGWNGPVVRLGFNEIARYAVNDQDLRELAILMSDALLQRQSTNEIGRKVASLRERYPHPHYNLRLEEAVEIFAPFPVVQEFIAAIMRLR